MVDRRYFVLQARELVVLIGDVAFDGYKPFDFI
jgi:hypothetical protein